ncbi:MAG: hypothetical protein AAF531_26250 [Actinomycetota bacterium]
MVAGIRRWTGWRRRLLLGVGCVALIGVLFALRAWYLVLGSEGLIVNEATQAQIDAIATDEVEIDIREVGCIGARTDGSETLNQMYNGPNADEARLLYYQAALECAPSPGQSGTLTAVVLVELELISDGLVDVNHAVGSCIVNELALLSDDPARTMAIGDGPDDRAIWDGALEACLRPQHLAILRGEPGAGPQAYGDSERLDRLEDDCRDGADAACDVLYLLSGTGSVYEDVAISCAGRSDTPSEWCTPELPTDPTGAVKSDAAGLVTLVAECRDRDLTACDLVARLAPVGSRAAEIGRTCAGELPVGARPDCRTRLGP